MEITELPKPKSLQDISESSEIYNIDLISKTIHVYIEEFGPIKRLSKIAEDLNYDTSVVVESIENLQSIGLVFQSEQGYTSDKLGKVDINLGDLDNSKRMSDHVYRLLYFCSEYLKGNTKHFLDTAVVLSSDEKTIDWYIQSQCELINEFFEKSEASKKDMICQFANAMLSLEVNKND